MLSKSFKIVNPKMFEIYVEDIDLVKEECIIKVKKAAICKADMRYYIGNREKRILELKYPMSLLHEATGVVLKDNTHQFKKGDEVVLIPNIINKAICHKCNNRICEEVTMGENFCKNAIFASSNYDGFSKSIVALPTDNIIKFNKKYDQVAVFCELISVCICAIRRCEKIKYISTVAIWGDGILAYIMSAILKIIYNKKVLVVGKHYSKLTKFYCDEYFFSDNCIHMPSSIKFAFECVGGEGAEKAINEILDRVDIGANIILTGVSENNVLINTRKILEKGIVLTGSTRSCMKDFELALKYLENDDFRKAIEKLIIKNIKLKDILNFYSVFEKTEKNKTIGKYIIDFCF